jgi:integrase
MKQRTPSYCRHKASGQAVVRIDGTDHYLGKYDTPPSRAEYNRLIAEWYANAQTLPAGVSAPGLTVNELLLRYWAWAGDYYRDLDGNPTRELENLRHSLKPLRRLYAHSLARDFGPLALRAVQDDLVERGLCRNVVNYRVNRVRRLFKWAVSYELVPPSVYQALQAVPGLRRGRGKARETEPVKPVEVRHVEATLPFQPAPVAAMAQLQLLTGCRAGEAMRMRAIDLNMSGPVWTYRPGSHKNQHRGLERVIHLGPRAQEIIRPFLTLDLQAFLFSPRAHVKALHALRAERRKTRRTPSELRRQRKLAPKRQPGERYTRRSYRLAIVRACRKAGVPPWSPLQLRHTAATFIRAKYGVEAAKVILGHTRVETSQIYAERDLIRAEQIMGEIG